MIKKSAFFLFFVLFASGNLNANPTLTTPSVALTGVTFSVSASGYNLEQACDYRLELEGNLVEPSVCSSAEVIEFDFLRFTEASSESVKLILDGNVVAISNSGLYCCINNNF